MCENCDFPAKNLRGLKLHMNAKQEVTKIELTVYCKATEKYLNTSLAAPGALAHRLQRRTACFIQNGQQGPEIGQTLGYWTLRSTFAK